MQGVYKLCDFGWATYACGDSRTTFCGTPLYVCPEVLKGQEYDTKADIWGLGIITYELTFGRVPFSIISQQDLLKIVSLALLRSKIQFISQCGVAPPNNLSPSLSKCSARTPRKDRL